MTRVALIACCTSFLACSLVVAENVRPVPQTTQRLDADFCLAVSRGKAVPDDEKCPAFITDQLPEQDRVCSDFKGTLQPGDSPEISTIDIDGDGRNEYLFVSDGTFVCPTAASLFGCGSSPCPEVMFQRAASDGKWHEIGDFPIGAQFSARARADHPHHPDLRIHCADANTCDPGLYRWQRSAADIPQPNGRPQPPYYRQIERTLRGYTVTMFAQGSLLTTTRKIPIHDAPRADAKVLYESDSGSYFAVFGAVKNTDFVAVSPCVACEPGFVHRADLGL